MASDVDIPGLTGRVFTDGVAQETIEEDGVIQVKLTVMGPERPGSVKLPRPVTIEKGGVLVMSVCWTGQEIPAAEETFRPRAEMTVTSAEICCGLPELPAGAWQQVR